MRKICFFILVLFSGISASAQWTTNTLLNTEVSNTKVGDCRTLTTNDGRTWFAYFKPVPAPNNYEMRAQLLDKDGVKLLGPEGVLVNNAPHPTFTTVFSAIVDGNNNLIVGFANASTNTIYINKINTSGAQVWNSSGVVFNNGLLPKFCVLTNGDIIVSWLSAVALKAPMQKLDAATGTPQWPAPIDVLTVTASHRSTPGNILPISGNGFIYVFHDRATASISSNLWAQRYNSDGVAQWPAPIQLSNKTTAYNKEYPMAMHKDTAFIGYDGATGLRIDDFLQRLNPDGTIPWGINGSDFATDNTYYEQNIKITIAPATNTVWATSAVTTTSQGSQGTYVQKFDKTTGARLFTDNGKMVYPIIPPPYAIPLGISLYSDNSPLLLLGKYNNAVSQFLYASKLDNNGNFVWPGDTVALGKFAVSKLRMTLTDVINNQAVAGWVENKGTNDLPYAQPIRIDGSTGLVAPVPSFTSNIKSACINNSIQFTSTSTGYVTDYLWSFPGGTPASSTAPNPLVTYNTSGVFNATLTVTNAGGSNSNTQTNYITIFANPAISAGPDKTIITGDVVTLDGSSVNSNVQSIIWSPATTITGGVNNLITTAKPTTTTTYTLTVKDNNNCTSTDDAIITVVPYCIKVMDAFTPNGDGINDKWIVTSGGACTSQVMVNVYNRYGDLVYSNDNYQNNWDGTYKGKALPDATYYYVIRFKLITGNGLQLKGDVTILR